MDTTHEEVLMRMRTMDTLLKDKSEELEDTIDVLDAYCYTLRMYSEWMIGTVGLSSTMYKEFANLKDAFLTFEVLLTLDNDNITGYVVTSLRPQIEKFQKHVSNMIISLEELM